MPGLMEDILWCILNPAYGLVRLHDAMPARGSAGILLETTDEVSMASATLSLLLLAYARWH